MREPIDTAPNPAGIGAPTITDAQFAKWLDEMSPFLVQGCSLYYAMDKTGLYKHGTAIYEKYRLGDWFAQKINILRATVGELTNLIGYQVLKHLHTKNIETAGAYEMKPHEVAVWKTTAEKHRAAQPFYVSRVENVDVDDTKLGKIIETLDNTNYDDMAREAQEQVVAIEPSVQGQE